MITLQAAQNIFEHVPRDVQVRIAEGLDVPLSEVYGVATFYSQFALERAASTSSAFAWGTACYVKGSKNILERLAKELDVKVGSTHQGRPLQPCATRAAWARAVLLRSS